MKKIDKNKILQAISDVTPFDYNTMEKLYRITKSYDALLRLSDISCEFNKNIFYLASFLYPDR